ncbi:MAG: VWA domain-containing protein, partial [Phycisphaerae bacterium]|nr:VWA domain-containing protein [Phycisphaerae bacterium]
MDRCLNILAQAETETRLEFARLPQHWSALLAMLLLAGMLYAVVWLYRREQRAEITPRLRFAMATLRCAVILVLAVIWVQPILATYIHQTTESRTLVFVDGSASMQLVDRYPDAARAARVREFLTDDGPDMSPSRNVLLAHLLTRDEGAWLAALAARNTVDLWRYGDVPERLATRRAGDAGVELPAVATQPAAVAAPMTDLGRAVRQAVREVGNAPIAALVVVGDGGLNAGESADVIARYAKARALPIHAVGIGDPDPPQNVRVSEIIAPANAFVRDPFAITVHLAAQGLTSGSIPVELIESDGRTEMTLDTQVARVAPDGRIAPITFTRQVAQAADLTYAVRAAPLPVESITDDNTKQTSVRVLERKMRVLLVAGAPEWDYRFVTRLLERDASVDVSCWLQSADVEAVRDGTTIITEFPTRPEQLFEYDVVLLFDPHPRDMDAAWCELVQSLVSSNGAGLLYVAGRKHASRFMTSPACQAIVEMLPVSLDPEAEIVINQLGHFQKQAWPAIVPQEALSHPVVRLEADSADTAALWSRAAGVYWHYPVRREKPLATVLLRHGNPRMRNAYGGHVLLATQLFGAGRTGFLAIDSTWRWRRYGEQHYNRFWIQLLRHLMEGKLLGGGRRGALLTDRDVYPVGTPILLTARLLGSNRAPLDLNEVTVTVSPEAGSETTIMLQPDEGRPGWFGGQCIASHVGRVQFRIDLSAAPGTEAETVTHSVQITQPNLEILRPQMDAAKLRLLAEHSAGGQYVEFDEAGAIPEQIEDRTISFVVTGSPVVLWDVYKWP